jgi:hypothetical protein
METPNIDKFFDDLEATLLGWKCGHCHTINRDEQQDCCECGWERRIVDVPDPHFRIGQLEGAIKGALPYFEEMTGHTEYLTRSEGDMPYATERAAEARQVIAKLKQLIGEKE